MDEREILQERIKRLRAEGNSMQQARLLIEREDMSAALFLADVDERCRWVLQKLIDRMPADGRD